MLGKASPRNPRLLHVFEITETRNLAGRMAHQRETHIGGIDPRAVVAHPQQRGAAALDFHVDASRLRIERVLDQLLDDGGRPLDYLAGSDLADEFIGQDLNRQWQPREPHMFAYRRSEGPRPGLTRPRLTRA